MPSFQSKLVNAVGRRVVRRAFERSKDVDALRAFFDRVDRAMPNKNGVNSTVVNLPACEAEWNEVPGRVSDRVVLYLPGGAWIIRTPRGHRKMAATLAKQARANVLLVFYRLAPENPFPSAVDDVVSAYQYLLDRGISPSRIVVGGDSAGGNLTLTLLLALRDRGLPLPAGAFALSPATDLSNEDTGSRLTNAELDPLLPGAGYISIPAQLLYVSGRKELLMDPYVSPLHGDLSGLPPLLLQVGSTEVLLDDSVKFAEKARLAGVDAEVEVWDSVCHVWQMMPMPEAERAMAHINDFIRRCTP